MNTRPYRIYFRGLWPQSQVRINYRPEIRKWPHEVETAARAYWQRLVSRHPNLFNGELATLEGYRRSRTGVLFLSLGRATYARLMYSNHMAEKWRFRQQQHQLVRVLGISAVVITSDMRIVLVKRSTRVGEYPGHWDVPGGHIHPPSSGLPDIFAAIAEEVTDELGVRKEDMGSAAVIGLAENRANAKPELVFRVEVNQPMQAILESWQHAAERFEFTEVQGIEASAKGIAAFVRCHAHETSPSALATLAVFAGAPQVS